MVPTNRPTVGYFTDSTSVFGVTNHDLSTNDDSDEGDDEGMYICQVRFGQLYMGII